MPNFITFAYNYIKVKGREKKVTHETIRNYLDGKRLIKRKKILAAKEGNQYILMRYRKVNLFLQEDLEQQNYFVLGHSISKCNRDMIKHLIRCKCGLVSFQHN